MTYKFNEYTKIQRLLEKEKITITDFLPKWYIFYFRNSNVIEKKRYTAVFQLFLIKRKDRLFYQNSQSYVPRHSGAETEKYNR